MNRKDKVEQDYYSQVEDAFSEFDLTPKENESLAKRLANSKISSVEELYDLFINFNTILKELGVPSAEAQRIAKLELPFIRSYTEKSLCLAKVLNMIDYIGKQPGMIMVSASKVHALKFYAKENNIKATGNMIYHNGILRKPGVKGKIDDIMIEHPFTKENADVVRHLAYLTPEKLMEQYGVTNEELADIYPTTKEALIILKKITNMSDDETLERYGLTKKELRGISPLTNESLSAIEKVVVSNKIKSMDDKKIQEHYGMTREALMAKTPLNHDTVAAFRTISKMEPYSVEIIFGKPKDEILARQSLSLKEIVDADKKPAVTDKREISRILFKAIKDKK